MKEETENFLREGMGRYKQATEVMLSFSNELESILQQILKQRKNWGPFIPNKGTKATKGSRNWSQYPAHGGRIDGKMNESNSFIGIEVNWYQSETDYPFYSIFIIPDDQYKKNFLNYKWSDKFEAHTHRLRFYPDPDDFNPERDFNLLIDEFVRFLNATK